MTRRVSIPALVLFLCAGLLGAHGGGLDRNGGHYNRKTGVYHCHRCPCGCGQEQGRQPSAPTKRQDVGDSSSSAKGKAEVRVWVNTNSGVYHCPGTRWYGNTKAGEFLPEKEARRLGNRPAYGRTCS